MSSLLVLVRVPLISLPNINSFPELLAKYLKMVNIA
jgi:hypothetical protein